MVRLSEKESHVVGCRREQVCMLLKGARAVHSKIICFSSPIAPLLQAKQTQAMTAAQACVVITQAQIHVSELIVLSLHVSPTVSLSVGKERAGRAGQSIWKWPSASTTKGGSAARWTEAHGHSHVVWQRIRM